MPTIIFIWKYDSKLRAWLHADGKFKIFLKRYLAFVFIAIPIIAVPMFMAYGYVAWISPAPESIYLRIIYMLPVFIIYIPLAGMAGFWWIETVVGYFIIALQICLYLATILVSVFRGLVWRIAEYNKGAWAAITVLFTVGVGIANFYVRYGS